MSEVGLGLGGKLVSIKCSSLTGLWIAAMVIYVKVISISLEQSYINAHRSKLVHGVYDQICVDGIPALEMLHTRGSTKLKILLKQDKSMANLFSMPREQ